MQPFSPHRLEGTPYRLDSVLGEGAMGEVYLGEHVDLRRPAVIKLIKGKYANEEQVVGRMRREARIVARIRHDALVTIYDLGTAADGRTFIAMEWLEGTVLRRIVQQRAPLPVDEALRLMAMACDGLEVAHQAGVIHRDVKPENLFVTAQGQLKVLDFGVAKPMNDGDLTSARTAAGMVLGTPRYMAPEQATGRALSAATDVYAVGCVLFELLTATPLFDGNDARDLLWHHMNTPPSTLSQRSGRAFDPRVEEIVRRALAKDPAQRFARAAELAVALRAVGERPVSVPPPRISAAPEKPTVRFDDVPTAIGESVDVHGKPTVRVDTGHHEPSVRIVPRELDATATSAFDQTRAIPAHALVDGVSTTQRSPIAAAPSPYASTAPPSFRASEPVRTAATEVLPEPANGGTGSLAAEVSTAPVERRGTPMWPFAAFGVVLAAVATFGILFLRGAKDATPSETTVATATPVESAAKTPEEPASAASTAQPANTEPPNADPAKAETGKAEIAKAESKGEPAKTSATTPAAAKPGTKVEPVVDAKPTAAPAETTAAPAAAPNNYEKAKASLADGDLDAAEREARFAIATHGNAARLLLGEVLEKKGKPALAREQYQKILQTDPNNGIAKTRLAKLGG